MWIVYQVRRITGISRGRIFYYQYIRQPIALYFSPIESGINLYNFQGETTWKNEFHHIRG